MPLFDWGLRRRYFWGGGRGDLLGTPLGDELTSVPSVGCRHWRRERDSNPRNRCRFSGFQDHHHRPLGHPSAPPFYSENCGFWYPRSAIAKTASALASGDETPAIHWQFLLPVLALVETVANNTTGTFNEAEREAA